jgi:hypothetical protein
MTKSRRRTPDTRAAVLDTLAHSATRADHGRGIGDETS